MMQFLKQNKLLVVGGIVVFLGLYGYFTFFPSKSASTDLVTTDDQTTTASHDLLATLSDLHTIKLDPSIFNDPTFLSLSDFGVSIPPQNVGRPNPFALFATDAPASKSPSSGTPGAKSK